MNIQEQPAPLAPGSQEPEAVSDKGFFGSLKLVFFNPTPLFEILKTKPSWLAPLILLFLVTFAISMFVQPYVLQSVRQDVMTFLNSNPNIPQQAIQQAEESFEKAENRTLASIVLSFLGAALMRGVFYFVVVTIIFLLGTVIFGGTSKYSRVMSMYAWVLPVWTLGLIVTAPLMIIKGSHSISLSLAVLIPPDPVNPVYFLLHNISLFNIWAVWLLGIGFSVMYGVSRTKGVVTMFLLWGVWVIANSFVPFLNFQAWITGLA